MEYKKFIGSLTKDQRFQLTEKSNAKGLQRLAFHFGVIVFLAILIWNSTAFTPLLMITQGIFIIFLFTLLHETIHKTAFRSPWLNRAISIICSHLIFLPADWFKYFHFEHHRHTHIPGKDPELIVPAPQSLYQYIKRVSGFPAWRSQINIIFKNAFTDVKYDYVPNSASNQVCKEARLMLMVYSLLTLISVISQSSILLYIWIIPILIGQPFLRLYLMAEHDRCPFVTNMFENTRTTFTNAFVRLIAWNMPLSC